MSQPLATLRSESLAERSRPIEQTREFTIQRQWWAPFIWEVLEIKPDQEPGNKSHRRVKTFYRKRAATDYLVERVKRSGVLDR